MTLRHKIPTRIVTIFISVMFAAISFTANAQFLGVVDNQVRIIVPSSSFNQLATLQQGGLVSSVSAVPLTGTLTTPTFSIVLEQDGANSKSGTYAVGIVLLEHVSARRLEVFIPGVTIAYDAGGNLGITLTNPTVNAYGRDASGSSEATANVTSAGSVTVTGNTLSFSTADQVTAIQGLGGAFGTIVNPITNTGLSYSYKLILKHTGGDFFDFRYDGLTTSFPTATSNEFVIAGSATDAATLSGGQKITGTLTYGTSSGGGGGGGSGLPSCTGDQILLDDACVAGTTTISNILSGINVPTQNVSQQDVAEVENAVSDFNALMVFNIQGISESKVSIGNTLALINGVNDGLALLGQATQGGGNTNVGVVSGTITNLANVFAAITSTETSLSTQELSEVSAQTVRTLSAATQSIRASTTQDEIAQLLSESATLIDQSRRIIGLINADVQSNTQSLMQAALETTLQDIALSIGANVAGINPTNIESVKAALNADSALKAAVVDFLGIDVQSKAVLDTVAIEGALLASGISSDAASNYASDLALFKNPAGISLEGFTSEDTLRQAIDTLGTSTSVSTESATNLVTLAIDGGVFPVNVAQSRIVPDSVPSGISSSPDGNVVSVSNGIATTLVPGIANPIDFAAAIGEAGATIRIETDGTVEIRGVDFNFTGKPTFEDIGLGDGQNGNISISNPQGNPAETSYYFVVSYPNGTSQKILPAVTSDSFFQFLAALGSGDSLDSNTGVVSVQGKFYRPSYFSSPPTADQIDFYNANLSGTGTALQEVGDLNSDGINDIVVITKTASQILYGL
ncbi:MAG: hypothetical protein RL839_11380 [Gammaproteobacteria bacterium]